MLRTFLCEIAGKIVRYSKVFSFRGSGSRTPNRSSVRRRCRQISPSPYLFLFSSQHLAHEISSVLAYKSRNPWKLQGKNFTISAFSCTILRLRASRARDQSRERLGLAKWAVSSGNASLIATICSFLVGKACALTGGAPFPLQWRTLTHVQIGAWDEVMIMHVYTGLNSPTITCHVRVPSGVVEESSGL